MIAIHINKIKTVQNNFLKETENQRKKALTKLKAINKNYFNLDEKNYLKSVINLFEGSSNIILYEPDDIQTLVDTFQTLPPNSRIDKKGRQKKPLKKFIIEALNYTYLRNSFYPKYFKEIGIKACVYCNSQLTITATKTSSGEYSAKYDVDHYNSKDNYPFLSISLFNLYPACASCNRLKGTNKIKFDLYTNDLVQTKKSEYGFKLDSNAKAKYLTTKDPKIIDFTFIEPSYNIPNVEKFNDIFHIEGIYQTQIDLIEELIIKSQIYNDSYLKTLKENFNKLKLHPELFKRTLVGNYTEEKDIHKRPMSKLIMDIAKELELIKY